MCRVLVRTLNVSILRGTTVVSVNQDSLEMDTTVQVCFTIMLQATSFCVTSLDIKECSNDHHTCPDGSYCINLNGSYHCKPNGKTFT